MEKVISDRTLEDKMYYTNLNSKTSLKKELKDEYSDQNPLK